MQNTSVTISPAVGQRAIVPASQQSARTERLESLASVTAVSRAGRHDGTAFIRADKTEGANPRDTNFDFDRRHAARRTPGRHEGAPTNAFMAQHIAQEVAPESPRFDQFQAGARAYILRRDSLMEILTTTDRLDIRV